MKDYKEVTSLPFWFCPWISFILVEVLERDS